MFAFYILYSKHGLSRHAPETVLFYSFGVAAIVWAIVTPPARGDGFTGADCNQCIELRLRQCRRAAARHGRHAADGSGDRAAGSDQCRSRA